MVSKNFYSGKQVLITGHTGFKGSWLSLWLLEMGAKVSGYSLAPEETPDSLYRLGGLSYAMQSQYSDIRDYEKLYNAINKFKPEIIFHMAAQALVLPSYENPIDTFSTNIMGTAYLLEAARKANCVKAIVNVTTDKCYDNNETGLPFREEDKLGGYDPYSASKAAAEIVSASYRNSFLADAGIHMATVRAGNVIGGGDFSKHRLIPDIIRAAKTGKSVNLRQPNSIRPWQYVLDVLRGYITLGQALYEDGKKYSQAFNLGPDETGITVGELADMLTTCMINPPLITRNESGKIHEAKTLNLDNKKAKSLLGWHPLLTTHQTVENTAQWYANYLAEPKNAAQFTLKQLQNYDAING